MAFSGSVVASGRVLPAGDPLYPWFGGKRRIAKDVWRRFGVVRNYVEPFYGSGAVHLMRPDWDWEDGCWVDGGMRLETVNDADGYVVNVWRAIAADPDGVARHMDWPVLEWDLHARHIWLLNQRELLLERLIGDPGWYDVKVAGWWLWGVCQWFGRGWCSGIGGWNLEDGKLVYRRGRPGVWLQRPHLSGFSLGVLRFTGDRLREILRRYSVRMRNVRVLCGDWSRALQKVATTVNGLTGVFLDPPYSDAAGRQDKLYSVDSLSVARDVREWCIENGDDPLLRIALCGYEGEHDMPDGWVRYRWTAPCGYARGERKGNWKRETIWFSPHCLNGDGGIFDADR